MPQISEDVIAELKRLAEHDIADEVDLMERIEDVASWGNSDDAFDAGESYGRGSTARWILDVLGIE